MPKPNFFIIGAPKCGTTALATWLAEHPNVYMSPRKEPHFFNDDHNYGELPNEDHYLRLFRGARALHRVVGEASVWYLYSQTAVRNILVRCPDARFLVCLRNPVEMAPSLHQQFLVSNFEDIRDFERAWRAQARRTGQRNIPRWCTEPKLLQYGQACSLGEQLERLYRTVPREQVLTVVLDDVRSDPRTEYRRILDFLELPDDGRESFAVVNPASRRRSYLLRNTVQAIGHIKRRLGVHRGLGFLNAIDRMNVRPHSRSPLSPQLRRELQDYFREDVHKLGELIDRDLAHWVDNAPARQAQTINRGEK